MESTVCANTNLSFLEQSIETQVEDNIVSVIIGYFIENSGTEEVSDVFNLGEVSFNDSFIIDNITINAPELFTITQKSGSIVYDANLGNLVPGETILVTLTFDIIGVTGTGNFLINNVTQISDGEGDCNIYADSTLVEVVQVDTRVKYRDNCFEFQMYNYSNAEVRIDVEANIITPANACFVFRNFVPFEAVYKNTDIPVPTNTVICSSEIIDLSVGGVRISPGGTMVFRVPFQLVSSNQVGKQFIAAQLILVKISEGDDRVRILNLPDKYDKATAEISLRLE